MARDAPMKIVAIMPVRNEAWVLGLTARAALMWADELLVLDHASTDVTRAICDAIRDEVGDRFHLWSEPEGTWQEMRHRQLLLEMARNRQASHIAIVDADEILTGNLIEQIKTDIGQTHGRAILQLPWLQCRGSIQEYHAGGVWAEQWVSFAFQDAAELHWKARDGYDFHHRHPMGRQLLPFRPIPRKLGGLLHLQMCSERRLKAKGALYKMTEVLRWPGRLSPEELNKMYDQAVFGRADKTCRDPHPMAQCKPDWWRPYDHLLKYLKLNADPWQEAECARLWAEHGPEKFAGLDLYGVIK